MHNAQNRTPELRQYLIRELGIAEVTPERVLPKLSKAFLESQSDDWTLHLYEFLNGQPALLRQGRLDDVPVVRLESGTHVTAREGTGCPGRRGEHIADIVISDRRGVCRRPPVHRRRLCRAHLRRDSPARMDLGGKAKHYGQELPGLAEDVLPGWHHVRDGTLARAGLRTYIEQLRPRPRDVPARGRVSGRAKTAALGGRLQGLEPAPWTVRAARGRGADQRPRRAGAAPGGAVAREVVWPRRRRGRRFVGRIPTVVQTPRLQQRSTRQSLQASPHAYRSQQPTPAFIEG
jgi:hypothetical protein